MKKLLIVIVLLLSVFIITGCEEEKEKISLVDPVFGYETVFKYDKKDNFSNIKKDDSGVSKSITFENKDLDVEFQMYYTRLLKKSYDISKETRSKQKYYKEYKFGKYEAYAYGESSSGLYLNILLGVDKTETAKALFVSIDRIDSNQNIVVGEVLDKYLIKFFNTIEVMEVDA